MPKTTDEVVTHHLEAFLDKDIDEIMADYAEDAVVMTPESTIRGHDAIRDLFLGGWSDAFKTVESFELKRQDAHGDTGYIVWTAETATLSFVMGSDTFVGIDCLRARIREDDSESERPGPGLRRTEE